MTDSIYKIFQTHEWDRFHGTGVFRGSAHDQRDGFIHLCAADQLSGTLAKHYKDVQMVVLAGFNESELRNVKWEVSRGGEKFPHVYGTLEMTALTNHIILTKSDAGVFILPENILESP